jgi:hypothetical protein
LTVVATFLESADVAEFPANAAAAAIRLEAAFVGSVAACSMAGPSVCTADSPGACRPSIGGGGGAGSAWATLVMPPSSNAADEPIATAEAIIVLVDDMSPPNAWL